MPQTPDLHGLLFLPPGRIAAVVTFLEMTAPPPDLTAPDLPSGIELQRASAPRPAWYRDLFRRVGAEWLWSSRLEHDDAALAAILGDADVELYRVTCGGRDEGLVELDFREPGACELAFFGMTRALIGSGAGRLLVRHAMCRAWSRPIGRFWVHTCTLDHPGALPLYRRAGFRAYRQAVEVEDDPRLVGLLPRSAAPQVPIFDELSSGSGAR